MVTREKSEKDDVFALLLFLFRKQRPLGQRLGAVWKIEIAVFFYKKRQLPRQKCAEYSKYSCAFFLATARFLRTIRLFLYFQTSPKNSLEKLLKNPISKIHLKLYFLVNGAAAEQRPQYYGYYTTFPCAGEYLFYKFPIQIQKFPLRRLCIICPPGFIL